MKKTVKTLLLLALALTIALLPTLALAEHATDGAGNMLATEADAAGATIGGDLYGVGRNVDASNAKIAESAILAGQNVNVNNATIGGSLRAAGQQISVANTAVDVNVTLAAYSVSLGQGFSAKAVYAAAQSVGFAGTCDALGVSAQTVTISGTVNGDANIYAEKVNVLDTAVITGALNVHASEAPVVAGGASVGSVHFTQRTEPDASTAVAAAAPVGAFAAFIAKLNKIIMMLPGRMILAVLYFFIIRRTVDGAADMVKTRPVAMPLSGFVTLISLPIAAIILFCTYIGIPAGALLLCLYALVLAFAVSFAGAMLGRLVFPKLHPLLAYVIGAAGVSIAKLIPFVSGLVTFGCMVYTLGYFIQKIYLGFGKKDYGAPEAQVLTPEPAEEAAQAAAPISE